MSTHTVLTCAICGQPAAARMDPPRSTLARGPDPEDPSFTLIAVLPKVDLCEDHDQAARSKDLLIGWCDDEQCRLYGEVDQLSPCGQPYQKLKS
jgi:hypothetical protein